jgi:hypothetical protein
MWKKGSLTLKSLSLSKNNILIKSKNKIKRKILIRIKKNTLTKENEKTGQSITGIAEMLTRTLLFQMPLKKKFLDLIRINFINNLMHSKSKLMCLMKKRVV